MRSVLRRAPASRTWRTAPRREALDAHPLAEAEGLDAGDGVVGRPVVDHAHAHALLDEARDGVLDDVGLVVGRDDREHVEVGGGRGAWARPARGRRSHDECVQASGELTRWPEGGRQAARGQQPRSSSQRDREVGRTRCGGRRARRGAKRLAIEPREDRHLRRARGRAGRRAAAGIDRCSMTSAHTTPPGRAAGRGRAAPVEGATVCADFVRSKRRRRRSPRRSARTPAPAPAASRQRRPMSICASRPCAGRARPPPHRRRADGSPRPRRAACRRSTRGRRARRARRQREVLGEAAADVRALGPHLDRRRRASVDARAPGGAAPTGGGRLVAERRTWGRTSATSSDPTAARHVPASIVVQRHGGAAAANFLGRRTS